MSLRINRNILTILLSINLGLTFAQSKIPYPIIFIHGLNSDSDTWNDFSWNLYNRYNLSFGGRLDYCLNFDNNNFNGIYNDDVRYFINSINTLTNADYYHLNFDVNVSGTFNPGLLTTVKSNQQAVYKQGRALGNAIMHILAITGKDKVILVGHSMGGLASREYLSNPDNWQSDGKHHVAKLFTTATPHGGSDSSLGWINNLSITPDEQSDAVRDLKTSYKNNFTNTRVANGVYLFGGFENNTNIYYGLIENYYNVDVNCNGIYNESIVGLNQKTSPSDVLYSCGIGIGKTLLNGTTDFFYNSDSNGDGVVGGKRANMKNYLKPQTPLAQIVADTFIFNKTSFTLTEFHTDMPKEYTTNMRGLDEPNDYNLGYDVNFNQTYMGWISEQQGLKGILHYDVDVFKFKTNPNMLTRLQLTTVGYNMNNGYLVNLSESLASSFVTNNNITDEVFDLGNSGNCYLQNSAEVPVNSLNLMYYLFKITEIPKIAIKLPSNISICRGNSVVIQPTVSGTGNLTYKWSDGSAFDFLFTTSPGIYTLTVSGLYDYKISAPIVITTNDCNTLTSSISFGEANIKRNIIYPNPASNTLYLDLAFKNTISEIEISDINGKVIFKKVTKNNLQIEIKEFPKGLYFLNITNSNTSENLKFIKE